jgi:hypothetical protein
MKDPLGKNKNKTNPTNYWICITIFAVILLSFIFSALSLYVSVAVSRRLGDIKLDGCKNAYPVF